VHAAPRIRGVEYPALANNDPGHDLLASGAAAPNRASKSQRSSRRTRSLAIAFMMLALAGCSETDLRGRYQVEIMIEQARAPIDAILILNSSPLETDSLPLEARLGVGTTDSTGEDYRDDQAAPNSCLIIPSDDPNDATPRIVTFFETRFRGKEAIVPFSIFDTPDQRIEVVKVQFFANALGGDVVFHEADGDRPGRLFGDRLGKPVGQQCVDAMGIYYARIQQLIEAQGISE